MVRSSERKEALQNEHIEGAVSRYSSLFTLPSHRKTHLLLCGQCLVAGVALALALCFSVNGLSVGLLLAALLFLSTSLANYVTTRILLSKDLILDFRRTSFLSFVSNLILLVFLLIATLAFSAFRDPNLWSRTVSMGVFASLVLRILVFCSVSFVDPWKAGFSVMLQPVVFLISILAFPFLPLGFQSHAFLYLASATLAAFLGVYVFISSLNSVGARSVGIPSIKMFKAFLANWTQDLVKPFEEILEQLSEERDVTVSMIAFRTGDRIKAVIVVPSIHPGPFRNIGSSSIPGQIQESLEKKLGCIVSVPHGISGHELDLASQAQNEEVLKRVLEASVFSSFHRHATSFLSIRKDGVTVGCQIFGDCPLLSLTLAPETMEDLPLELGDTIVEAAARQGYVCAVAIDAHNSIQGPFDAEKAAGPVGDAAAAALKKASHFGLSPFEVGAAKVVPSGLSIKEGMGPGGITVLAVKVGEQKTAYVTIDGNNMVRGLREKVLSSLHELGIAGGEVLTTDTHVVNAVVMADRGYHPVGEVIDHRRLIDHIKTAVGEALENLDPAEVSWRQERIHGIRVIGERQIDELCSVVDETAEKAKKTSAVVFPAFAILLTALLFFL